MSGGYQSIAVPDASSPRNGAVEVDASNGEGDAFGIKRHLPSSAATRATIRDFFLGTIFGVLATLIFAVCFGGGDRYIPHALEPRQWRPSSLHRNGITSPRQPTGHFLRFHRPRRTVKVSIGPRPYFLLSQMDDNDPLKEELGQCADRIEVFRPSDFVLGHRGAALQFPEHTTRSHDAASRMGAGLVECDVNLTKDRQLVCRHMRCDLHQTTNVLLVPELAKKCTQPFVPAKTGTAAKAKCCTTDFTLDEIQSLCGKMHSFNGRAKTPREYVGNTPHFQTDLYSHDCPHIQSHRDYIETVDGNGGNFVPEFKMLDYDFDQRKDGYTREMYLQQILDDYKGISPRRVYPQGFTWEDMFHVVKHFPQFSANAFALDKNMTTELYTRRQLRDYFRPLIANNVPAIAPAIFMLLDVDVDGNIVPSLYAKVAREMGLDIIAWTLERSDALALGGGWYYSTIADALEKDSDLLNVLNVLVKEVGIKAIFTDWAATATFYANCNGLLLK